VREGDPQRDFADGSPLGSLASLDDPCRLLGFGHLVWEAIDRCGFRCCPLIAVGLLCLAETCPTSCEVGS
jgi:hypothetical protein